MLDLREFIIGEGKKVYNTNYYEAWKKYDFITITMKFRVGLQQKLSLNDYPCCNKWNIPNFRHFIWTNITFRAYIK